MKLTMKPAIAALVATTLLTSTAAIAGPGSVTSAGVTQGKLELKNDLIAAFDYEDDANEEYEAKLEVEYGVTDKLQLKLEGEGKHTAGADTEFEKVKLAAKHELTKQGDYFFDSAAQLSYSIGTTSGKADEIEGELILAKNIGAYEFKSNFELAEEVGDHSEESALFELKLGGYTKLDSGVTVGLEYYGDFGELGDMQSYDEQKHFIGPRAKWGYDIAEGTELKFELGYYAGISEAAEDATLLLRTKFEFE